MLYSLVVYQSLPNLNNEIVSLGYNFSGFVTWNKSLNF